MNRSNGPIFSAFAGSVLGPFVRLSVPLMRAADGPVYGVQPGMTPGSGIVSSGWLPGPEHARDGSVEVSLTDFRAATDGDLEEIYQTGMTLGESWPIMSGAVGLWLWGKPSELRGGSVSVWRTDADLRRFVSWPVHVSIMNAWRPRIEVRVHHWTDSTFIPARAWSRAEEYMRLPRDVNQEPLARR
jgi:hypothetical protein